MILHPAVLALLIASILISFLVLHAGWYGLRILLKWDITSGSELQLSLERRTYLISTILGYSLFFQIISLFLFIYTVDSIHDLFFGAMCAAGTLNVNPYGYPTLILKIVNSLLAGVWLIINYADTQGFDYPLIKVKYLLLILIVPLVLVETFFLFRYFSGLHADVITSCCGTLFSSDKETISGDLAGLPNRPMMIAFYSSMAATYASGLYFFLTRRGGYLFPVSCFLTFIIAAASLISFICLYFYELPTHHCPFCILQKEYGHIGYVLYLTLLGGAVAGSGAGALMPFRNRRSLSQVIPSLQQRLAVVTLLSYALFTLIVTYRILTTPFKLQ